MDTKSKNIVFSSNCKKQVIACSPSPNVWPSVGRAISWGSEPPKPFSTSTPNLTNGLAVQQAESPLKAL